MHALFQQKLIENEMLNVLKIYGCSKVQKNWTLNVFFWNKIIACRNITISFDKPTSFNFSFLLIANTPQCQEAFIYIVIESQCNNFTISSHHILTLSTNTEIEIAWLNICIATTSKRSDKYGSWTQVHTP